MLATHTRTQPVLQSAAVSVYALESKGEVGSQADPRRSVIWIQHQTHPGRARRFCGDGDAR